MVELSEALTCNPEAPVSSNNKSVKSCSEGLNHLKKSS